MGDVAKRFDFDHWPVAHALGGSTHPSNLTPRLRAEHREKTARKDIPAIAKVKRLSAAHEASRARMLAKDRGETVRTGKRKAAFPKQRGFDKSKTKHFDGRISDRDPRS